MIERNLLLGNGINIAFSKNNDYKNYMIIERLTKYLGTNRYDEVFHGSISSAELYEMLRQLNDGFKNMIKGVAALKWTENKDELRTLVDIARRYNNKSQELSDVGIEDYFFVMKQFFNRVGDDATPINLLYDGLKYLFLDSIFNEGKIENLYLSMDCFAKELIKYSQIFTVNYDTNIDKLTSKPVYHLHGSFDVLDDTYKPDTIIGFVAQQKENPPKIVDNMKHLFCNAIMGFSGKYKMDRINIYSNGNMAMDSMITRLNNPLDIEAKQKYKQLERSINPNDIFAFRSIKARLQYPELKNTEYPINEFNSICGELHIIGMSPNNDSHIFSLINDNPKITNVVYFSASDEDILTAQKVIKKSIKIRNVFKYWESIGI